MDTSRTSLLQQTSKQLQPYIKNLSFGRLGDHLGEFEKTFPLDENIYHFLPQDPMAPMRLRPDDMVRVVMPIHDGITYTCDGQLESVLYTWLLLKRGGEDGFGTSWWIHRASFTRDQHGSLPPCKTWFSAKESTILPATEENLERSFREDILLEIPGRLDLAIGKWVEKSSNSRKEVLKKLTRLQKEFPVPKEK